MGLRKDSNSLCIQAVLRTHPEPHVVFAIPREGPFCTSNHQTCPEINAAPSHLHVLHEVPHCKWLHSSGHLLLPALLWTLVLPWGRIMTGYFTPHPQLPCPASSPVLFALETLSSPGKTPVFDKSMGLLLPAKFTLTYWTGSNQKDCSRRNGVG